MWYVFVCFCCSVRVIYFLNWINNGEYCIWDVRYMRKNCICFEEFSSKMFFFVVVFCYKCRLIFVWSSFSFFGYVILKYFFLEVNKLRVVIIIEWVKFVKIFYKVRYNCWLIDYLEYVFDNVCVIFGNFWWVCLRIVFDLYFLINILLSSLVKCFRSFMFRGK